MWTIPWQHLKTAIFDIAVAARDKATSEQRTFLGDFLELDHQVVAAVCARLGVKEKRIYMHVATGGFWGEDQIAALRDCDGKCPHCGAEHAETTHITWERNVLESRNARVRLQPTT